MQCFFLCMKHALEEKILKGLDSKRQKMLALCRNTLNGALERLSSQFDEMGRKLCMGRGLCFPDKCIAGMQWFTKFISSAVDKWFSGNNFLAPCCNANTSKLRKKTSIYYTAPNEQWSSAVTHLNNLHPSSPCSLGTSQNSEIVTLNYFVIFFCAAFPGWRAATKHPVSPLHQSLLKALGSW